MARHRVGLIVASDNTTVEDELGRLLREFDGHAISVHSSRIRVAPGSPVHRQIIFSQLERAVMELGDARVDVLLIADVASLVSLPAGLVEDVEARAAEQLATGGSATKVRSGLGTLLEALTALSARRLAIVADPSELATAEHLVRYLQGRGLSVSCVQAGPSVAEQVVQGADPSQVDAVLLGAGNARAWLETAAEVIPLCAVPVLTINTASASGVARALGLTVPDRFRQAPCDSVMSASIIQEA